MQDQTCLAGCCRELLFLMRLPGQGQSCLWKVSVQNRILGKNSPPPECSKSGCLCRGRCQRSLCTAWVTSFPQSSCCCCAAAAEPWCVVEHGELAACGDSSPGRAHQGSCLKGHLLWLPAMSQQQGRS